MACHAACVLAVFSWAAGTPAIARQNAEHNKPQSFANYSVSDWTNHPPLSAQPDFPPRPQLQMDLAKQEKTGDTARPNATAFEDTPEILYDVSLLPEPVQRMRRLIIEACKTGDIERLRPLLGTGASATQLRLSETDADSITLLRQSSGDEDGIEIMAILLEIMQAGFVHMSAEDGSGYYVWPYFFALPLETLQPAQKVELFTILTAGDYEEMKIFGSYIFFRSAISEDGSWMFFVAGD